MNVKEWKLLEKHGNDWFWRNKAVKYFNLQRGQVIHHLRDTEEQRNFNDKYYHCKYTCIVIMFDIRYWKYETILELRLDKMKKVVEKTPQE